MADEVGNEAARLLTELIGGGKELTATVIAGRFASPQPLQVKFPTWISMKENELNALKVWRGKVQNLSNPFWVRWETCYIPTSY